MQVFKSMYYLEPWSMDHIVLLEQLTNTLQDLTSTRMIIEYIPILYINQANFISAVEGCWGRGLLDHVKWKYCSTKI